MKIQTSIHIEWFVHIVKMNLIEANKYMNKEITCIFRIYKGDNLTLMAEKKASPFPEGN